MADIAPELYARIQSEYRQNIRNDKTLQRLIADVKAGNVAPDTMPRAAERIGENASKALKSVLKADALPNGELYYNIATRTVVPELEAVFGDVNAFCESAQKIANTNAGVGLNPVSARLNESRIGGFVEKLTSAPIADVDWMLGEPVINFAQSVHNDFVRENASAQYNSGLSPKITRRVMGSCCDWCEGLSGTYDYGEEPDTFYRMHENCRCQVIFQPVKDKRGNYQDSHTKKWYSEESEARKERLDALAERQRQQEIERKRRIAAAMGD